MSFDSEGRRVHDYIFLIKRWISLATGNLLKRDIRGKWSMAARMSWDSRPEHGLEGDRE
jgi:hypothetical protein